MLDCLIVGGGIIGCAIGDELARSGRAVTIVNSPPYSTTATKTGALTASIASAGILPPPAARAKYDPLEQLRTLSNELFADWARHLQRDTGIDVDYSECGGIQLARTTGDAIALQVAVDDWTRDGVSVEELSGSTWSNLEPMIDFSDVTRAYRIPGEQRVRPAALLKALTERATSNGMTARETTRTVRLESDRNRAIALVDGETLEPRELIVAAGPWSTDLLRPFGFDIGVEPRRGQIAMWQLDSEIVHHVVNEGPRYVLCRSDGELIAGSTVEEVGFDCRPTEEGIESLVAFASQLVPALRKKPPTATWAGLRPHSRDGIPSIGRVTAIDNLTLATGHFRSGIHLAPATARVIRQIINNESTEMELSPFNARRN